MSQGKELADSLAFDVLSRDLRYSPVGRHALRGPALADMAVAQRAGQMILRPPEPAEPGPAALLDDHATALIETLIVQLLKPILRRLGLSVSEDLLTLAVHAFWQTLQEARRRGKR